MKYLFINEYWPINKEYSINKLLYLMVDRPNYINNYYNDFLWYNNEEQLHRNYDLPAWVFIFSDKRCNLYWRINNIKHRESSNTPVFIRTDGYKGYYANGNFIKIERPK